MTKQVPLLKLKNVSKFYYNKGMVSSGFSKVNLELNLGEFVVITGESGSGKSTLLNVLSGLDTYEEGEMYICGEETSHYNDSDFEHYRKTYIGNIFQSFNLVNSYTVYQNVELVLLLNGYQKKEIESKVLELIKQVDLEAFKNTKVSKLSGGQKQRVAIARALAKDTPIIIADEPTGNLDSRSAKSVIKLLSEIAKDKLVVIVTHNYEQVEEYATRKLEMHDGKIREDIDLRTYEQSEAKVIAFQDITIGNKLRLGIRNTFNILPKFVLMFLVFLLISIAFLAEQASFRKLEYEDAGQGYSDYFSNVDDKRIVINKKDGSYISESDFAQINALENVKSITEMDLLLDRYYEISNDYNYFFGTFVSIDEVPKLSGGRMPSAPNEVVVSGHYLDYSFEDEETLFNYAMRIRDLYGGQVVGDIKEVKIVGYIKDEDYLGNDIIYASAELIANLQLNVNQQYSTTKVTLNEQTFTPMEYDPFMQVLPSDKVPVGKAYVSYDAAGYCRDFSCLNAPLKINIENMYYTEELNLTITQHFTTSNFTSLTGYDNYEEYRYYIFISSQDYNNLYNKNTYQSSVFANDYRNVDALASSLEELGYKTLKLKDSVFDDAAAIKAIIRIFKLVVTIILFIIMFFIAYFVIRLIQKSKNVYYATIRILGASKNVIKNLIRIELFTVFHLTYLIVLIFIAFIKLEVITSDYLATLITYLNFGDYLVIYLLMLAMSYLISMRYSRKLFKSSAMKTYSEEV